MEVDVPRILGEEEERRGPGKGLPQNRGMFWQRNKMQDCGVAEGGLHTCLGSHLATRAKN